jgi:hypothetical protein
MPIETAVASAGLSIIMLFTNQCHTAHDEQLAASIILFFLTAFVTWRRYKKEAIKAEKFYFCCTKLTIYN